jgi:hypothetical protein
VRALRQARRSGTRIFEPAIHVERAELARAMGDAARAEEELLEAQRLFSEVGAPEQAARLGAREGALPAAPAS